MTDFETMVANHSVEISHLKELRTEENKRHMDVLERVWSSLNDLKDRVTMMHEHTNQLQDLRKEMDAMKAERNKVLGGWFTLTTVGAGVVAVGIWIANHFCKP